MRNRLFIIWTVVAAAIAAALFAFALPSAGGSGEAAPGNNDAATGDTSPDIPPPEDPPDPANLTFGVDPTLQPSMPAVEQLADGRPRPTARLRSTGGTESDVVLDELLVTFADDDELDAFLARWNGVVVESDPDEDEGVTDYLVRIDPSTADLEQFAVDLLAVEPHHQGELRASDETVFSLMAIAASESAHHGTEVSMNWVAQSFGIREGSTAESPDRPDPNAFNWPWISSTQPQDSGIDAALQLLYGRGTLANHVEIMIVDRGFFYNADFPLEAKMRKGEWRRENPGKCSNDSECPFHGTDVTMAAMGRFDNGFGTAGPAAPIADLIALEGDSDIWGRLRDVKKVAKEEKPDIINMSFGLEITAFQDATERKADRWFRKIRDKYGALSFASAGNDGKDVDSNDALSMPCEVDSVICVGGVQSSPLSRSPGSNFGSKTGSSTVDIYGPMCTYGLVNPDVPGDSTTKTVCGTSVASPVVAGVAALVKAANPTLGPKDVWNILQDTAHRDPLGPEVTGNNHRVDAHAAVAAAMGVGYDSPKVEITGPAEGTEFRQDEFFELSATAESFARLDLPIQWRRGDGTVINSVPTLDPVVVGELPPGTHVFQAVATDVTGTSNGDSVKVVVKNDPPVLSISSPAANTVRYDVEEVLLAGSSSDSDDYWQELPDEQVVWQVRDLDSGTVVYDVEGHTASIPPHTLDPGDYEVLFRGVDDGGAVGSDSSLLTILAVPAGESLPDVDILAPEADASYSVDSYGNATISLRAIAHDDQDGAIGGERMRWIAEQGATRIVLCEGSDFGEGGDIASGHDCADVDVILGVPPEAPANNRWTLTVEVYDSANLPARASRVVTVQDIEG